MLVESAPLVLPFRRRAGRIAYYTAMLRELAEATTFQRPMSKGPRLVYTESVKAGSKGDDPRGREPLTCIKCNVSKLREDFKNKTYNLKLKPTHPAYGKKQQCRECDGVQRKLTEQDFRIAAIKYRGGVCAHCGDTDSAHLELEGVTESSKRPKMARLASTAHTERLKELKKTVPLCLTCRAHKSTDASITESAVRTMTTLNKARTSWPAPKRGHRQPKLVESNGGRTASTINDLPSAEDALEPFHGLAIRANDDEPTVLRFEPKRIFTFRKFTRKQGAFK